MSYFCDAQEATAVYSTFLERFLSSPDGERVSELVATLPGPPVLELRLTEPEVVLSCDFSERRVVAGPAENPSVQLEIEASTLHDVFLERLDPVQLSRPFEEDRAALVGTPEALVGLIGMAGILASHYPESLEEQGRSDLLETPRPPNADIWGSDGPPRRVIGARRPWQRVKGAGAAA